MRLPISVLVLAAITWAGCGSGPSTSSTPPPSPPPSSGGGTTSGGGLTTPVQIHVAANSTTSGTDIVVPNTASSFNVQMLGVNSVGATQGSASNVGGSVARGSSAIILIFGPGLTGTETLAFSGPNDITISAETPVKATDGTPGIQFTITVAGNAAVGARTLNVTNSSGSASTFTGGVEVY